jgi:hypothetical protein
MEFLLVQEDARSYSLAISEIELADEDNGPDRLTLWLTDRDAIALLEAVEAGIGEYVAEMRLHQKLYEASKHRHEDEVDPGEGYDLDDPKHPTYRERMTGFYDFREGK